MANTSLPGAGGTEIIVPDDQLGLIDINTIEFEDPTTGETFEGTQTTVGKPVEDITSVVPAGETLVMTGKKVSNSTYNTETKKGETTSLTLQNNSNENVEIVVEGGGNADFTVEAGKFKKSSFDGGKGKANHSVELGSSAALLKSDFDMGKGSHTFKIEAGAKLKKTSALDLGQGGKDKVIIGSDIDSGKGGKLKITSKWQKKDTLTVAGEKVSYKDVVNGDLPKFIKYEPEA